MKRFACLALLAGCASPPVFTMRPGATDADFNLDSGQCLAQANSISTPGAGQPRTVYVYCMQGKGWQRAK